MPSACRCSDETLLTGIPADDYSTEHLVRDAVAEGGAEIVYRCPQTGRRWVGEFVPDETGVQTFRLRRILRAAELVELLARTPDPAMRIPWVDPEVEFRPPGAKRVYHGLEEAKAWAERAATDPGFPRSTAVSLIEVADDECVVLGSTAFRRGDAYREHRPAAWLVTLRNGRVVRSLWFDSWKAARKEVGLADDAPPGRRIGGFLFALRQPRLRTEP